MQRNFGSDERDLLCIKQNIFCISEVEREHDFQATFYTINVSMCYGIQETYKLALGVLLSHIVSTICKRECDEEDEIILWINV